MAPDNIYSALAADPEDVNNYYQPPALALESIAGEAQSKNDIDQQSEPIQQSELAQQPEMF